jgi:CubicO group peptidase (beta-lactamase class C family)
MTYIERWLAFRQTYLRVPGVQAAVLFDHEVVLSEAYGLADIDAGTPLTTSHLFRVASHSKTFTATAVMQLVEAGLVRLDDPVGRWLPFLTQASSPVASVTLREMLTHSSGMIRDGVEADYWQCSEQFPDEQTLRRIALDNANILEPNVQFKYSNIAYSLLGLVIGAVAGRPYADQVRAQIVDQLGLVDTGPELDRSRNADYAAGYSSLAYADGRVLIEHVDTRAMASATGFYSTASDLCQYSSAHFMGDERLLTDQSKRQMQHEWWPIVGPADGAYGLGFSIVPLAGRRLVGHGGGYPGHITRTVFDAEAKLAVSVMTNAIDGPAEDLALSMVRIIDLAARQAADRSEVPAGHEKFCGRFANLWGVRDVALLGGRLCLLDPTVADPTAAPAFFDVEGDTTLRVALGPGYASVGEPMDYSFAGNGRIESVRGPGGLTWWPLADFQRNGAARAPIP